MSDAHFAFDLHHTDKNSSARCSTFHTPHGSVDLPTFMPVGTLASVKGVEVDLLRQTETQMVLCNAYHLSLRPGAEVVQQLGGLHQFMGWNGPILTDSGGFQLYSLAKMTQVHEEGAIFRSHIDGQLLELTPERAVHIQEALGCDVAMVLDHVVQLPNDRKTIVDATERTVRWARRCRKAVTRDDQALFAIIQGGLDPELRLSCAEELFALDFAGYAVGGLSVGETPQEMYKVLDHLTSVMPMDRPRYLMGVGRPEDLLEAIRRGIDLFDCVIPTRNGRNAMAFTDQGTLRLRNSCHASDDRPLEPHCPCPACRRSRGYLRHLFMAGEMLGPILLSIHNIAYYQRLLEGARAAIMADRFEAYYRDKMAAWSQTTTDPSDTPL